MAKTLQRLSCNGGIKLSDFLLKLCNHWHTNLSLILGIAVATILNFLVGKYFTFKRSSKSIAVLNFVRIKCIFIAALVIRIVILRTEQVTMRKMHLNESKGQHLSCLSTALSLIYVE